MGTPSASAAHSASIPPPLPLAAPISPGLSVVPAGLDFEQLLSILRRRQRLLISVSALVLSVTAGYTVWQRIFQPSYEGNFRLLVNEPLSSTSQQTNVALQGPDADLPNLIEVLSSPMLLAPIAKSLGVDSGKLISGVMLTQPVENADGVIQVNLIWDDPRQGSRVLDGMAKQYLAYSLRQRQEKLYQGLAFIDEQAPILQKRMDALQQELATFRLRHNVLDPTVKAEELRKIQDQVTESLRALRIKEAELNSLEVTVRQGNLSSSLFSQLSGLRANPASTGGRGIASGSFSGSEQLTFGVDKLSSGPVPALLAELTDVEKQLALASASFRGASPNVASLSAQRNRLRMLLQRYQLEAIQAALVENRSSQAELQQQLETASMGFRSNPILQKQYDSIQQRLTVARENQGAYIKSREGFRLEIAQDSVPWQIISPPSFNDNPVKPNVGRNLLLGSILGLFAGTGAALFRDSLDRVFHSAREVADGLPFPLLGGMPSLPQVKQGGPISDLTAQLSPQQTFELREALRNMIASFRLLRADRPVRVLALTSTQAGEGKSTTTALLAEAFAELGQRVLLIDANMREPAMHRLFGVANARGLSNLLTEARQPIEPFLHHPSPNLAVLPAGPPPPDPAKLLASERALQFVDDVRHYAGTDYDNYALVIFDTPEALTLSDPVVLSEHLDGVLFLVSLGAVNRQLPAEALRRFEVGGVDVLGLITTPLRPSVQRHGNGNGNGYSNGNGHGLQGTLARHGETNTAASAIQRRLKGGFSTLKRLWRWVDNHVG